MGQFLNKLNDNAGIFILALLIIVVLLIFYLIITNVQLNSIKKKYLYLVGSENVDKEGVPITVLLEQYINHVKNVEKSHKDFEENLQIANKKLENSIQKIGVVRYNPFDDIGGNFCFALALLDEKNNGVMLNSIYSREGSYIYAKSIESGASAHTLSSEENEALNIALKK